jgi:DNA-binding transcriptional LysR family regulator
MPPALSERGFDMANWRMWMEAAGVDDFDDSRTIVFGTSTDALQTAIDGDAVALADFSIVANDLSEGRLVGEALPIGTDDGSGVRLVLCLSRTRPTMPASSPSKHGSCMGLQKRHA